LNLEESHVHSINNFLISYGIDLTVVFIVIAFVIIALLYLYQLSKTASLLERKKKLLEISSDLTDHAVIVFSNHYKVISVNEHVQQFLQISKGDSLEKIAAKPFIRIEEKWISLKELLDLYTHRATHDILYLTDVYIKTETKNKPVNIHISSSDITRKIHYFGLAIFDITDKLELSKIYYQNTITGLPNHNKAIADIGLMANKMLSSKQKFAVAVISIDNFLEIISAIGYNQSLSLISTIAHYLQESSVKNDLHLYHMTNYNFLLIIPDAQNKKKTIALVDRYKVDCEHLLHTKNTNLHFTISAGISIYPENTIEDLLNRAYQALLLANKQGLGYTVIAESDQAISTETTPIEYSEIKQALESDQFVLYYQPIYDTLNHTISSAEALIRWIHPAKGIITPDQFLPLIEKTGFMKSLSEYVSIKTIKQIATWKKLGFREIQVSINLSMREFELTDYHMFLDTLLKKHNVAASQLKVEITENIAMANETYSKVQFTKLKNLGIDISLDDFGTGYSSFSMLESFPIDTVKIDKSFILDMTKNNDHYTIVKAMIAMTHALGIKVIAEGIEDKRTALSLKELECDYMQGYHFGRPMPTFEFQELIRSNRQLSKSDDIMLEKEDI